MRCLVLTAILLVLLFTAGCSAPGGKTPLIAENQTIRDSPTTRPESPTQTPIGNGSGTPAGGLSPETSNGQGQTSSGAGTTGYIPPATPFPAQGNLSTLPSGSPGAQGTISPPFQPLLPVSVPVPSPPPLPNITIVPPSVPVPATPSLSSTPALPSPAPQTQTTIAPITPPLPGTPANQTYIPTPLSPTTRPT